MLKTSNSTNIHTNSDPCESEDALIEIVLSNIYKFIDGDISVSRELPIGAGIVDIVAAQIEKKHLKQIHYSSLTNLQAFILSQLHFKQRLKIETISERTGISNSAVKQTLDTLCEFGFSTQSGSCYIRAKPVVSNLISIEGKLKNWKRALQQAIRNQLFSSRSFVAIDTKYSRPALNNLMLFKKYRIGLAVVSNNNHVHLIYDPPSSIPIAPIMPILAQTILLERVTSQEI